MADALTSPLPPDVAIIPKGEHTTPSNEHERALPTGGIPLPQGEIRPKDTDVIPAVAQTTLTQIPHPDTVRAAAAGPKPEPFGRQMNGTVEGQVPGDIELDPQVFPRAKVPGADKSGVENTSTLSGSGQPAMTKASTSPAQSGNVQAQSSPAPQKS